MSNFIYPFFIFLTTRFWYLKNFQSNKKIRLTRDYNYKGLLKSKERLFYNLNNVNIKLGLRQDQLKFKSTLEIIHLNVSFFLNLCQT